MQDKGNFMDKIILNTNHLKLYLETKSIGLSITFNRYFDEIFLDIVIGILEIRVIK